MRARFRLFYPFALAALLLGSGLYAGAASPSGLDWFQLLTNQQTGADNTGDAGTGNPDDLNYYYVGQSFTTQIQIQSNGPGSTAGNIWIDYQSASDTASGLTTGSFYNSWSSQVVSSTVSPGLGRVYSTGFNIPVTQSSGVGTFGTVTWTIARPSEPAYATSSPRTLDINTGTIGNTTESNISLSGSDLLDSAEDFQFHAWADVTKPFAETNNIASGTVNVPIDSDYLFRLFDTKKGEGFSTSTAYNAGGVGTGVNTATPPGVISISPSHFTPTAVDSYSCSGTWGTNVCNVTIAPPSPTGIGSDSRNWQYSTAYTLCLSGYQDLASPSQDQLGDANGPNTMNPKCFGFTTEADTVAPQVVSENPAANSSGNSANTNITINVEDRKTYPAGPSGVGVATSTCAFDVWTTTQATTTYAVSDPTVSTSPISYGKQYIINPAADFPQNERVYVRVTACQDLVGNTMAPDQWHFDTADADAPYVTNLLPDNDQVAATTTNVQFSIVDTGSGVDLANTVVYINGNYYSSGGGAGVVTNVGTLISFATSTDFTPFVSNTSTNQYNFNIGPLTFSSGESVPIVIYSKDNSGNLMPVYIYGLTANGAGICPSGTTYCGSNTSWNGSQCVGTIPAPSGGSGGSCSTSGGGGATSPPNTINEPTVYIVQINETSVLLSWNSNLDGSARVVYGKNPTVDLTARPNYGYEQSTPEFNDNSVHHSVVIDHLQTGQLYYFRAITRANGVEAISNELRMAPAFATTVIDNNGNVVGTQPVCPIVPPLNPVSPPTRPSRNGPVPVVPTTPVSHPPVTPVSNPPVTQPPAAPVVTPAVPSDQPSVFIERTTFKSPALVGAALLLFLLIIILLSLNMIRLGKIADKLAEQGNGKKRRHGSHATAFAMLMIGFALVSGLFINVETGAFPAALNAVLPQARADIQVNVAGSITDADGHPVSGLLVAAGDTSILTTNSGAYAFNNASKQAGLMIYSTELKKGFNKEITDHSPMNFIFDPAVMSSLENVVNLEAKGDFRTLYKEEFSDSLKSVVSSDAFESRYSKKVDASFASAETIYIGNVEKLDHFVSKLDQRTIPQVINIEVFTMNGIANYVFALEQGKWKLIF